MINHSIEFRIKKNIKLLSNTSYPQFNKKKNVYLSHLPFILVMDLNFNIEIDTKLKCQSQQIHADTEVCFVLKLILH